MNPALDQTQINATATSRQGIRGRLIRGLSATALGPIVTALVQVVSVPLLLHAWGTARYGDWLLLSAIPSYLTLSDLGFGDASGSDMSVRVAANDKSGALETFQSSWVLITSISLTILLLAGGLVWWIPWQRWLRLSSVSSPEAAAVLHGQHRSASRPSPQPADPELQLAARPRRQRDLRRRPDGLSPRRSSCRQVQALG